MPHVRVEEIEMVRRNIQGAAFSILGASLFTLIVNVSGARGTDGTGESTLVSKETVHSNRKSDVVKRPIGCQFYGVVLQEIIFSSQDFENSTKQTIRGHFEVCPP